jgi:hypothetical protein
MESVRLVAADSISTPLPCCRCGQAERSWDRIAGKAYCPNCQEALALGEAPPLVERTEKNRCAVCNRLGTVCFHTFPLRGPDPVAVDLCPEHLRGLIARGLGPQAFHQIRRRLQSLGLAADEIFLLHGAFYDSHGRALQPANETT